MLNVKFGLNNKSVACTLVQQLTKCRNGNTVKSAQQSPYQLSKVRKYSPWYSKIATYPQEINMIKTTPPQNQWHIRVRRFHLDHLNNHKKYHPNNYRIVKRGPLLNMSSTCTNSSGALLVPLAYSKRDNKGKPHAAQQGRVTCPKEIAPCPTHQRMVNSNDIEDYAIAPSCGGTGHIWLTTYLKRHKNIFTGTLNTQGEVNSKDKVITYI